MRCHVSAASQPLWPGLVGGRAGSLRVLAQGGRGARAAAGGGHALRALGLRGLRGLLDAPLGGGRRDLEGEAGPHSAGPHRPSARVFGEAGAPELVLHRRGHGALLAGCRQARGEEAESRQALRSRPEPAAGARATL